jgi:TrmH family RNA methyltransferase
MTNAEIKRIKSLSQKKFRDELGLFVAEGEKLVEEAVRSSFAIQKIVATQTPAFAAPCHLVETVSPATMARLSGLKTPPAMLAVIEKPQAVPLPAVSAEALLLALDNVQDPGNLGTIIRLADWFGICHIVCSAGTADCHNPKVVQASMGAIFRVSIHYTDLAVFLQNAGGEVPVYGTFLDGANIYRQPLTPGGILVMGNEGQGISPEVAARVSSRLLVPPYPESAAATESLNVAVSTAVVCAEFRRKANYSM